MNALLFARRGWFLHSISLGWVLIDQLRHVNVLVLQVKVIFAIPIHFPPQFCFHRRPLYSYFCNDVNSSPSSLLTFLLEAEDENNSDKDILIGIFPVNIIWLNNRCTFFLRLWFQNVCFIIMVKYNYSLVKGNRSLLEILWTGLVDGFFFIPLRTAMASIILIL